jgi:hypothetical protein
MLRMWLGEARTMLAEVALALQARGHDPAVTVDADAVLRGFAARCSEVTPAAGAARSTGRVPRAPRRPRG